jgi:hypothetical protein
MGKMQNVYPYTDLLAYADHKGICSWNEAIDLFKEAGKIPFYESSAKEIYPFEEEDKEGMNPKYVEMINGFCEQEKIDFVTIIDS